MLHPKDANISQPTRRFLEPMRDVGIHHVFAQIAFVLAFDKQRVEDNLERIYGIEHMPGDTQMRESLDPCRLPRCGPSCKRVFGQLQCGQKEVTRQ